MTKILSLIIIVVMAVGLVSCSGILGERGDVTFVIENRDGSYEVYKAYLEDVENKDEGVYGVVELLIKREKNPLSADIAEAVYGAYINSIGSLTPDASKNEYISIYTSLEKDFSTREPVGVIEYEGVTLKSAGVGLSSMSAEKGTVILFRIETYEAY